MNPTPGVIAIDGPAASGKGTLARRLARLYGLPHLDAAVLAAGLPLADEAAATAAARALDLEALDEASLRGAAMGEAASVVAAMPAVRAALFELQRGFAARPGGAVLDGRDIGTVICPDAAVKLFVTATPERRAERRHRELVLKEGAAAPAFETVLADILRRDARDSGRPDAPLRPAASAFVLDTTDLGIEEAFAAARAAIEGAPG
jgi:cytidylate kinase